LSLPATVPDLHLSYSYSAMQKQETYANYALLEHLTSNVLQSIVVKNA